MKRETGYYWVKFLQAWNIAFWEEPTGKWMLSGIKQVFTDYNFAEIDERKIVRPTPEGFVKVDLNNQNRHLG